MPDISAFVRRSYNFSPEVLLRYLDNHQRIAYLLSESATFHFLLFEPRADSSSRAQRPCPYFKHFTTKCSFAKTVFVKLSILLHPFILFFLNNFGFSDKGSISPEVSSANGLPRFHVIARDHMHDERLGLLHVHDVDRRQRETLQCS